MLAVHALNPTGGQYTPAESHQDCPRIAVRYPCSQEYLGGKNLLTQGLMSKQHA